MLLIPLILLGIALVHPLHVSAATIAVTAGTVDETDNGNCSLYEAVEAANTGTTVDECVGSSGADTINIPDGTYNLAATSHNLQLDSDISLVGTSRSGTILNGGDTYGLTVTSGNISLSTLTVEHGVGLYSNSSTISSVTIDNTIWQDNSTETGTQRSGIDISRSSGSAEAFTMTNSIVRNNTAGEGGGVYVRGFDEATITNIEVYGNTETSTHQKSAVDIRATTVTVSDSDFHDNTKVTALSVSGDNVTIRDTVVRDNTGDHLAGLGGGINIFTESDSGTERVATLENVAIVNNQGQAMLVVSNDNFGYTFNARNVTIANNTSLLPVFYAYTNSETDPVAGHVDNVTIANNTRTGPLGDGSFTSFAAAFIIGAKVDPTLQLKNVLMANNKDETTPTNCMAASNDTRNPISAGNNFSSDSSCTAFLNQASDQNNKDAQIDTLVAEANTWVVPLKAGSPAINTGGVVAGLTTDQRGIARPQGSAYDIGAYEWNGIASNNTTSNTKGGGNAPLAETGVITTSTIILGAIILLALIVIFFDYRKHKRPLTEIDPNVSYSFGHHIRVVTIPLVRYRLQIKVSKPNNDPNGVHKF